MNTCKTTVKHVLIFFVFHTVIVIQGVFFENVIRPSIFQLLRLLYPGTFCLPFSYSFPLGCLLCSYLDCLLSLLSVDATNTENPLPVLLDCFWLSTSYISSQCRTIPDLRKGLFRFGYFIRKPFQWYQPSWEIRLLRNYCIWKAVTSVKFVRGKYHGL